MIRLLDIATRNGSHDLVDQRHEAPLFGFTALVVGVAMAVALTLAPGIGTKRLVALPAGEGQDLSGSTEFAALCDSATSTVALGGRTVTRASECNANPHVDVARPLRSDIDTTDASGVLFDSSFDGSTADGAQSFVVRSGEWIQMNKGTMTQTMDCGYDYTALLDGYVVEDFRWEATFGASETKNQGGLVFNQSSVDSRSGAMLVDLTDGGDTLRWGYYDADGRYVYLGHRNMVARSIDQTISLAVEVRGDSVDIFVDDVYVASTEAQFTGGMVGLVTSVATVDFHEATLTAFTDSSSQTSAYSSGGSAKTSMAR